MDSIEIITSQRGKDILLINGYKFSFQKLLREGDLKRWKCSKVSCKAYVKTALGNDCILKESNLSHNHPSKPSELLKRNRLSNVLKRKALEKPSQSTEQLLRETATPELLQSLTKRDIYYVKKNAYRLRKISKQKEIEEHVVEKNKAHKDIHTAKSKNDGDNAKFNIAFPTDDNGTDGELLEIVKQECEIENLEETISIPVEIKNEASDFSEINQNVLIADVVEGNLTTEMLEPKKEVLDDIIIIKKEDTSQVAETSSESSLVTTAEETPVINNERLPSFPPHPTSTPLLEDEFDIVGKNVAAKLRQLPPTQRIFAERLINEVLFEAQLGTLTRECALVNTANNTSVQVTYESQQLNTVDMKPFL